MRAPIRPLAATLAILLAAASGARAQTPEQILDEVRVLTPRALRALVDTAEAGDSLAQFKVGLAYYYGYAVESMPEQAAGWFRRAAEAGSVAAQHMLGVQLRDGNGVEQNLEEAARLLRGAAESGYRDAEYDYGLMLFDGTGVEQDYAEAYALFSEAAEKGAAEARAFVGIMLVNGLGVERDVAAGHDALLQAAKAGSPTAQANLGALYVNGVGVEQDAMEALIWFYMAQANGFVGVESFIADMTQSMSDSTVAALQKDAERRATEYLAEASRAGAAAAARVDNAESGAALQSIGDWLAAQLPDFGTFTFFVRRTTGGGRGRSQLTNERAERTISDVSLDGCRLQFVGVTDLGDPVRTEWSVNLDKVDPERLRVAEWDMPEGVQPAGGHVFAVYMEPLEATDAQESAIVGREAIGLPNYELVLSIPFEGQNSADEVMGKLGEAIALCGGGR